jgi:hypothetical protein
MIGSSGSSAGESKWAHASLSRTTSHSVASAKRSNERKRMMNSKKKIETKPSDDT